jgi:hypothetical protein
MTRLIHPSAITGTGVWLLLVAVLPGNGYVRMLDLLILLAVLLVAPLGLVLAASDARAGLLPYRAAQVIQPVAALLVIVAFLLPAGPLAAALASGWLLMNGLAALSVLAALRSRGIGRADELCLDAGLLYLPIGGAWLLASRLGINPLGFGDTIVLLTAIHFHYAGFAAPILAGMAGRRLAAVRPSAWGVFRVVAAGIVASVPLVALGITFSPALEVAAACVLAASLAGLSALTMRAIVPALRRRAAQALLTISAASALVAMLFAVAYAVGEFTQAPIVTIPRMIEVHGLVNALGFVSCGLVGWTLEG